MAKITYDFKAMKFMALFQKITKTDLKDCILGEIIIFVVLENQIGKAIGKKGANVRTLERILKTRVKLVEWSPVLFKFIQNLIYPARLKGISQDEDVVLLEPIDLKTRGILIGRNASNLRQLEQTIQRYYKIQEIKVK